MSQTMRQEGNNLYLDITAEQAWLKDLARKFPAVIDPTLVLQPDPANSVDTFAAANDPANPHNALDYISVGNNPSWGT